jgi:hypothetical protein
MATLSWTAHPDAEKYADRREEVASKGTRLQVREALLLSFDREPLLGPPPPPSPPLKLVPNTPSHEAGAALTAVDAPIRTFSLNRSSDEEKEEREEEEKVVEVALVPPPSTAPAMLQVSRAGRKRAPTMKALDAEQGPKWGTGGGLGPELRGVGRAEGRRNRAKIVTPRFLYPSPNQERRPASFDMVYSCGILL